MGYPGGSDSKESSCSAGDPSSFPGLGRSPGEGNGNPLQYFCLENPMDGGAWQTIVHGVTKSQTPLSKHVNPYNTYILEKNLKKVDICICIPDSLCRRAETKSTIPQ